MMTHYASTGLMIQSMSSCLTKALVLVMCSFFSVGSRDSSCRIYSLHRIRGFHYVTLAAHRSALVACFFEQSSLNVSSSFVLGVNGVVGVNRQ